MQAPTHSLMPLSFTQVGQEIPGGRAFHTNKRMQSASIQELNAVQHISMGLTCSKLMRWIGGGGALAIRRDDPQHHGRDLR